MTTLYRLRSEPAGTVYERFLRYLLLKERAFGLVWREQLRFTEDAKNFGQLLTPFRIAHRRTDHWPGTKLIGHYAIVETYRCDMAVLPILSAPGRLIAWLQPKYPEDLHFVSKTGFPSLITVAHDEDAWIASREVARGVSQLIPLEKEALGHEDHKIFGLEA